MKRILVLAVGTATIVLISVVAFAAVGSDVADAAMRGDKAVVRKLIQQKIDVNAPQADGATALQWAVYHGDKELTDALIAAGANVKAANREGVTPLWLACINGDAAIITALLNAGADPNEHLPLGRSPLMIASRTGKLDAMKVLIDRGADVNAKETARGTTPLMWAADEGHSDAMQLLIQRGADINARSNPAARGRGPALGKANDPRKAVAAQGAALAAREAAPDLNVLNALTGARDARTQQRGGANGAAAGVDDQDDAAVAAGFGRRPAPIDGGGLTPLIYAARS